MCCCVLLPCVPLLISHQTKRKNKKGGRADFAEDFRGKNLAQMSIVAFFKGLYEERAPSGLPLAVSVFIRIVVNQGLVPAQF